MALKTEEATITLREELHNNPSNAIPTYLMDYSDCLLLLFNGNPVEYSLFKKKLDSRISIIEKGTKNSPWYRFCLANINFHWAVVHLKFGENIKAASKFRKSFILLKENKLLFPNFKENNVLLGLEEAIAGAIPESYKWLGAILGVKGNVNKGVNEIAKYLKENPQNEAPLYEEAMIYYTYLKFYLLSAPETAWKYINGGQYNEDGNLLRSFIKANLALNYRKADVALDLLKKAENLKEYHLYPILQYERAEAMLYNLDFDSEIYYNRFLKDFKGDNFCKDAWLKQAWINHLKHNQKKKEYCLAQINTTGNSLTDADKQAVRFAEKPIWGIPELLEVRLLIDGGFYQMALTRIQSIDKKRLVGTSDILDYNFRYGRIFEELNQLPKALVFYTATISLGKDRKEYYAARAALQKGFIFERQGKTMQAKLQFKECLSMRNHDFQSSIDQLAKAGLNRLGA